VISEGGEGATGRSAGDGAESLLCAPFRRCREWKEATTWFPFREILIVEFHSLGRCRAATFHRIDRCRMQASAEDKDAAAILEALAAGVWEGQRFGGKVHAVTELRISYTFVRPPAQCVVGSQR